MYRFGGIFGFLLLVAGCAAPGEAPPASTSAILQPAIRAAFQPGEGDFAPDLVYRSGTGSQQVYDKILLDPILYFAPLEQQRRVSSGDRQILLNNFYILMSEELGKDFELVQEPQPGTVRVQFAVLPVTEDPVAIDTVSMVLSKADEDRVVRDLLASPIARGGEIVVEAMWMDAQTGSTLGATVDRHLGRQAIDTEQLKNWADVNQLLRDYAVLIRYRICRYRGAEGCVTPPEPLR